MVSLDLVDRYQGLSLFLSFHLLLSVNIYKMRNVCGTKIKKQRNSAIFQSMKIKNNRKNKGKKTKKKTRMNR